MSANDPLDAASLSEADLLRIALGTADFRQAQAAARAIAFRSDLNLERVLGSLADGLRHREVLVQRRSAQALALLGAGAESVVAPLVEASLGPHWTVREAALQALGAMVATSPEARSALIHSALHDRNALVRRAAAQALSTCDQADPAVSELVQALQHHYPRVRCRALRALVHFESRRSELLPLFERMLNESHAKVRRAAAEVIGTCGPVGLPSVPALLRRLRDRDAGVHAAAAAALAHLRQFLTPDVQRVLDVLVRPDPVEVNLRVVLTQPGLTDLLQAAEEAAGSRVPDDRHLERIRTAAREREVFRLQSRLWKRLLQAPTTYKAEPGAPIEEQ